MSGRSSMPLRGWCPSSRATATGSAVGTSPSIAAEFSDTIAVGTIYELDGLPDGPTPVVLTPVLEAPEEISPILTVGSLEHVAALSSWPGRVIVKLASSMRRFGGGIGLVEKARASGLRVEGVSIHPPLAGGDRQHRAEIERWLDVVDPSLAGLGQPPLADGVRAAPHVASLPAAARHGAVARRQVRVAARGVRVAHHHDRRGRARRVPTRHGGARRNAGDHRCGHRQRRAPAGRRAQPVPSRTSTAGADRATAHAHVDGVRAGRRHVPHDGDMARSAAAAHDHAGRRDFDGSDKSATWPRRRPRGSP